MAEQFWLDQITEAQAQLALINPAIRFLYANPHESYTLETGQGSQRVKRPDLDGLISQKRGLQNEIAELEARCNGASQQIVPGF